MAVARVPAASDSHGPSGATSAWSAAATVTNVRPSQTQTTTDSPMSPSVRGTERTRPTAWTRCATCLDTASCCLAKKRCPGRESRYRSNRGRTNVAPRIAAVPAAASHAVATTKLRGNAPSGNPSKARKKIPDKKIRSKARSITRVPSTRMAGERSWRRNPMTRSASPARNGITLLTAMPVRNGRMQSLTCRLGSSARNRSHQRTMRTA